jgi:hypothetical protein
MLKPEYLNLGIDTDAINQLYTCGGEKGERIPEGGNMEELFETSLLDLANLCLKSMARESPSDPII